MVHIHVLFKNRASECNKELLDFLHRNIGKIKGHFQLTATIVAKHPDHQLPAARIGDKLIVGKSAIINELKTMYSDSMRPKTDDDVWRTYITEQMQSGDNESEDRSGDIAKKLAAQAFQQREDNNKSRNRHNIPKSQPSKNVTKRTGQSLSKSPGETLPSELEKDPMMAKYWANQGM